MLLQGLSTIFYITFFGLIFVMAGVLILELARPWPEKRKEREQKRQEKRRKKLREFEQKKLAEYQNKHN